MELAPELPEAEALRKAGLVKTDGVQDLGAAELEAVNKQILNILKISAINH